MKVLFWSVAIAGCFASLAHGQLLLDNFNGSNVLTNNGSGAINHTSSTTALRIGIGSAVTLTSSPVNGAHYTPGANWASTSLVTTTGNTKGGTAYGLNSQGVDFSITVDDVTVSSDDSVNGADMPNSGNAGFRWELGVVSANATGDVQLYTNTKGGIYVNLFYDKEGVLSGDLRAIDTTKPGNKDAPGTTGIYELASFTLPSGTTGASYTDPLTVTFDLTSTGYSVDFSKTATVTSGSLSGTFNSSEQTGFSSGVLLTAFGQGLNSGFGNGYVTQLEIADAPEPPAVWLMVVGVLAAAGFAPLRRLRV